MSILSRTATGNVQSATTSSRLCALAAVGLFAVGALLATHHIATFKQTVARLARKQKELGELEKLYSESLTTEAARRLWSRRHGSESAAPLQEAVSSALPPNAAVEIRYRKPEAVHPGWTSRRADLKLSKAQLESVVGLCRQLETARPPWRVTCIRMESSTRSAGVVDAVLELQTLAQNRDP